MPVSSSSYGNLSHVTLLATLGWDNQFNMLVFIDESGDHNLDITKSDHSYDIFVLCAVLINEEGFKIFDNKLRQIKIQMFGSDDFVIHTREMTRPNRANDRRNTRLINQNFRRKFYTKLNYLIDKTKFKIIVSIIMKDRIVGKMWQDLDDPYIFGFEFLLNRILYHCRDEGCKIFPEKRTHTEDLKLELAFLRAKNSGTKFFRGKEVSQIITEFRLTNKNENNNGLQLADLVATPIGRHALGKKPKSIGNEVEYQILAKKITQDNLLIFP